MADIDTGLGGSQTNQFIDQQSPQSQVGQDSFLPNNATDFQNAGTSDTLNKAGNQSLQVISSGQPDTASTPEVASSRMGLGIGIVASISVIVIIIIIVRAMRRSLYEPEMVTESSSPEPAQSSVTSVQNNQPNTPQPPGKKKKNKRKSPPGRRRK